MTLTYIKVAKCLVRLFAASVLNCTTRTNEQVFLGEFLGLVEGRSCSTPQHPNTLKADVSDLEVRVYDLPLRVQVFIIQGLWGLYGYPKP